MIDDNVSINSAKNIELTMTEESITHAGLNANHAGALIRSKQLYEGWKRIEIEYEKVLTFNQELDLRENIDGMYFLKMKLENGQGVQNKIFIRK